MSDPLQTALGYHRSGDLPQAERIYRTLLDADPRQPEVLHLLGTLLHQRGDSAQAAELIAQAVALAPEAANYHSNLADVQRALGQLAEAEASCRKALRLRPGYPDALHNLGVVLARQRRHGEAEQAYRDSLARAPGRGVTLAALADAVREQGRIREALDLYRQALDRLPDAYMIQGNYGLLLAERGELQQGLQHCRRAVELKPDSALAHHNLGKLLLEYGAIDEALDELAAANDLSPESGPLCVDIGRAWLELADLAQAKAWCERALKLDATLSEARCCLGNVLLEAGDPEGAIEVFQQVLEAEPARVEAHLGLARAKLEQGDVEGAVAGHRETIRLRPEGAALHAALGQTLSNAGDLEAAVACHRQALECNPNCVPAYAGLATTLRGKATDEDLDRIQSLLAAPWINDRRSFALHFGLAQVYDGRGEYVAAAAHLATANVLQKRFFETRDQGYDVDEHRRHVERLMAAFTPDYFARVRGFGRDSQRPVFIVGMPRSGTTLTEQILASHPQVHGAGERRFATLGFSLLPRVVGAKVSPFEVLPGIERGAVEQLADWHLARLDELDRGRMARVVDKMPDNYQMLGWLVTLFPHARFIHCRRDVRDVALSCWMTNFGQIRWASDLRHLADRINQYLRLMDHWRRVVQVPMLEIDYEQTVADQEGTSRKLLEFLDLPWDPACLEFHRTERLVRTASVAQVRQPIYRTSVAKWKRYEAALEPLLAALDAGGF